MIFSPTYTLLQYRGAYDTFVATLDGKFKTSVEQRLKRLADHGAGAGANVTKKLRDGIYECRAQRERQQARLIWFYMKGKRIIVTVGFIKKKGKVPPLLIEQAIKIKKLLEDNPELLDEITEIH